MNAKEIVFQEQSSYSFTRGAFFFVTFVNFLLDLVILLSNSHTLVY